MYIKNKYFFNYNLIRTIFNEYIKNSIFSSKQQTSNNKPE